MPAMTVVFGAFISESGDEINARVYGFDGGNAGGINKMKRIVIIFFIGPARLMQFALKYAF
jgi:hypothetical protein